jgi:hypothetical protein
MSYHKIQTALFSTGLSDTDRNEYLVHFPVF